MSEVALRVAATTSAQDLAGAIAGTIREGKTPVLRAVGSRATYQAVKAIILAESYLDAKLTCTLRKVVIGGNGKSKSKMIAILFFVREEK